MEQERELTGILTANDTLLGSISIAGEPIYSEVEIIYDINLSYEQSPAFWSAVNLDDGNQHIFIPVLEDRIVITTITGDNFLSNDRQDNVLVNIGNDYSEIVSLTRTYGTFTGTCVYPGMICLYLPVTNVLKEIVRPVDYVSLDNTVAVMKMGSLVRKSADTQFRGIETYSDYIERLHRIDPTAIILETEEDVNEYEWQDLRQKDHALWVFHLR